MELLIEQSNYNGTLESCEEHTPKKEMEEHLDIYEYDYNKRLWF